METVKSTMEFRKNKKYSNKTIEKHSREISTSGQFIGGEHTIITATNTFVMLVEGAWHGGKSIFYKCVN